MTSVSLTNTNHGDDIERAVGGLRFFGESQPGLPLVILLCLRAEAESMRDELREYRATLKRWTMDSGSTFLQGRC